MATGNGRNGNEVVAAKRMTIFSTTFVRGLDRRARCFKKHSLGGCAIDRAAIMLAAERGKCIIVSAPQGRYPLVIAGDIDCPQALKLLLPEVCGSFKYNFHSTDSCNIFKDCFNGHLEQSVWC